LVEADGFDQAHRAEARVAQPRHVLTVGEGEAARSVLAIIVAPISTPNGLALRSLSGK
jgi:hypothetical protein